ncbi:hypothetical protein LINGRAHAP2_LOCUS22893, partial [Linum grandiflorum]
MMRSFHRVFHWHEDGKDRMLRLERNDGAGCLVYRDIKLQPVVVVILSFYSELWSVGICMSLSDFVVSLNLSHILVVDEAVSDFVLCLISFGILFCALHFEFTHVSCSPVSSSNVSKFAYNFIVGEE